MNHVENPLSKRGADDDQATLSRTVIEVDSERVGEDGRSLREGHAVLQ
jgi:hypothetical protein